MNGEEFVEVIKQSVLEVSIKSMQTKLTSPAGRKPAEQLMRMSAWFLTLKEQEKDVVMQIVRETARVSVFGFLCVLDGVRAIENENKGTLKLYYERDNERILLNDQDHFALHDLL